MAGFIAGLEVLISNLLALAVILPCVMLELRVPPAVPGTRPAGGAATVPGRAAPAHEEARA